MKQWLPRLSAIIMISASVASFAPPASAVGLNLAWNNCFPTGAVDNTVVCDIASNGNIYQLYGSIISGIAIPDLASQEDVIDVQVANANLDDWWRLTSGECRDGSLSVQFQGFANGTTCIKTLFGGSIVPLTNWDSQAPPELGLNHGRLRLVCSRVTGIAMSGTTQYQLFLVNIDGVHSAFDPADPGTPECAGCSDKGCIVFNSCNLLAISGAKNMITTPDQRRYVTWQGGPSGDLTCQATSVRRQTWGRVKSLYR